MPHRMPAGYLFLLVAYAIPTVGPFFVSTAKLTRTIGVMLIISAAATVVMRHQALTLVWCFFAAIVSSAVILVVPGTRSVGTIPQVVTSTL